MEQRDWHGDDVGCVAEERQIGVSCGDGYGPRQWGLRAAAAAAVTNSGVQGQEAWEPPP